MKRRLLEAPAFATGPDTSALSAPLREPILPFPGEGRGLVTVNDRWREAIASPSSVRAPSASEKLGPGLRRGTET